MLDAFCLHLCHFLQVRVLTLGEGSPYEQLHDYVSAAVAPYFKSFVRESGKADREGMTTVTSFYFRFRKENFYFW